MGAVPLILSALSFVAAAAQKQCYRLDGSSADSAYAPCNPDAEVSGCCALNKDNPDVCLSSGLCMSQDSGFQGFIYSNGCTDKAGKDPSCPNPCKSASLNGGGPATAYNVLQCAPGSQYCCRPFGNNDNCCGNVVTYTIGSFVAAATASSTTATATSTGGSDAISTSTPQVCANRLANGSDNTCQEDKSTIVGGAVGGVLGAALLASLGALAFLLMRRKKDHVPLQEVREVAPPAPPKFPHAVYELPPGQKLPEMAA